MEQQQQLQHALSRRTSLCVVSLAGVLVALWVVAFSVVVLFGRKCLKKAREGKTNDRGTEAPSTHGGKPTLSRLGTAVTSPSSTSSLVEKGGEEATPDAPRAFVLPFHTTILEGMPWHVRIFFALWILTLGPLLLLLRVFLVCVIVSIKGISALYQSWVFSGVLGCRYNIHDCDDLPTNDTRPVVFTSNHHITYDLGFVSFCNKIRFGLCRTKIMVHQKVYDSAILKRAFGKQRDELFVIKGQDKSYLDTFYDWIQTSNASGVRDAMILAPAGMTTHKSFVTPMHWKYFATEGNVIQVMVNVDFDNPWCQ